MSRLARLVIPGLPHHVTLRANNRRRLFSYPREYRHFLFLLGRGLARADCALHALALMVNHVHLIVTPFEAGALARFVKLVAQRYAQGRNLARNGSGRLFEERFFSCPIVDERQLAVTTAYVELNPVRAGMVSHPAEHRWSTYRLHAGNRPDPWIPEALWTPSSWYLGLGNTRDARAQAHAAFVADCHARDERPQILSLQDLRHGELQSTDRSRLERPDRSSSR